MAAPTDYLNEALDQLEARIHTVWTDKNLTVYDEQTRRVNWRVLIEKGSLPLPFVVISIGPAVPTESYGIANRTSLYDVAVFYIRSSSPTSGETSDKSKVFSVVQELLFLLGTDLYVDAGNNVTKFQLMMDPTYDVSGTNPANAVFIEASAPYLAGSISFQMLCGSS